MKVLERSIQKTNVWIKDAEQALKWNDEHKTFTALRAVLHALRDRVTNQEAVQLGAQLPTFIRGAYYDGWKLRPKPVRDRTRYGFLSAIEKPFGKDQAAAIDTLHVARSIFQFLNQKISQGEIDDIRAILPKTLGDLWPEKNGAGTQKKAAAVKRLKTVRTRLEPTVRELFHAASKENRAVTGLARTLQSLNDGRARKVFYDPAVPLHGFACSVCGSMFAADRENCTLCGSPLHEVDNMSCHIIEFAHAHEVPVRAVRGNDGKLLTRSAGSIGAFIRTSRASNVGLA